MSRFTIDSFTTAVVGPGATLDFDRAFSSNFVDLYKVKITPSVVAGTVEFYIHKTAARPPGDEVYYTDPWPDAVYYDPVEDVSGVYAERAEGFLCRYEDEDAGYELHCRITNNDANPKTFDIEITYEESPFAANVVGVPDGLSAAGMGNGLNCRSGVESGLNNATIFEAEFRAKFYAPGALLPGYVDLRTPAEGGTFTHNGVTQLIITGLFANKYGAQYSFISANAGRWYFAWKLENTLGWSHWTDGNDTPEWVSQFFDTSDNEDIGPPADWQVTLEKGQATNTYVVRATRPETNGNLILGCAAQVKDSSIGAWRELDDNVGAAETHYDGSGIDHIFIPAAGAIVTPGAWGTAAVGDLILYDVRGNGLWNLEYCNWAVIEEIVGNAIGFAGGGGQLALLNTAHMAGPVYDQIRLKIVKPLWDWPYTDGYFGAQSNRGLYSFPMLYDTATKTFVTPPIVVPSGISQVEARVYFANAYSTSDDGLTRSAEIVGGPGTIGDGYLFTRFNDRDWWVPTLQQIENIALTLNGIGTVTAADVGATRINAYGCGGVAGRFRIFPDTDGTIQVRSKWLVTWTIPPLAHADAQMIAMILDMEGYNPAAAADSFAHAIAAQNVCVAGPSQELRLGHATRMWAESFDGFSISVCKTQTQIAAPAYPVEIELRLTIDEDNVNIIGGVVVWKTYEYQIAGGGWNTIPGAAPGPDMYDRRSANGAIRGYRPNLYYWLTQVLAGNQATLLEFEITKGISVRF